MREMESSQFKRTMSATLPQVSGLSFFPLPLFAVSTRSNKLSPQPLRAISCSSSDVSHVNSHSFYNTLYPQTFFNPQ